MNFFKTKITFILLSSLLFSLDLSELENCVNFDVQLDRSDYYSGENLFLNININIDEGFHIYSVDTSKSLSPTFNEIIDSTFILFDVVGDLKESTPQKKYDPNFNQDVFIHKKYVQLISINKPQIIKYIMRYK